MACFTNSLSFELPQPPHPRHELSSSIGHSTSELPLVACRGLLLSISFQSTYGCLESKFVLRLSRMDVNDQSSCSFHLNTTRRSLISTLKNRALVLEYHQPSDSTLLGLLGKNYTLITRIRDFEDFLVCSACYRSIRAQSIESSTCHFKSCFWRVDEPSLGVKGYVSRFSRFVVPRLISIVSFGYLYFVIVKAPSSAFSAMRNAIVVTNPSAF